jgi:riboflavin synthase
MFTGLVADLGSVIGIDHSDDGVRLAIQADGLLSELHDGDSIAVNGVCLTAVEVAERHFTADVMNETLARSSLQEIAIGSAVNLELPLRATDRCRRDRRGGAGRVLAARPRARPRRGPAVRR